MNDEHHSLKLTFYKAEIYDQNIRLNIARMVRANCAMDGHECKLAGTQQIQNGPEIQPQNEQRSQAKLLGVQTKHYCLGEQNFLGRAAPWPPPQRALPLRTHIQRLENTGPSHNPLTVHGLGWGGTALPGGRLGLNNKTPISPYEGMRTLAGLLL